MSEHDLDALRRVYAEWEAGNLRAGRELLAADVESVWPEGFPSAGVYRGPDGHARAMREWLSPWEDFELQADGFFASGDRVVVPFRVRARGGGSGIAVERRWAHVWTMRDGKVVRFEVSLEPTQALASVGLSGDDPGEVSPRTSHQKRG